MSLRIRTKKKNEAKRTIVLYSPDMDLCLSLRMLFQEQYNIVTTTEPEIMMMMVKSFKPELVIVDAPPTDRMRFRFAQMRKENPRVHIMIFYASFFDNPRLHDFIRQSVDAAFSKPIDLTEVTKQINEFTMNTH
ncbi:MAG: hypothetical protein HY960_13980 [Ignavibacteriae bacterium]|nr:hypothetical protein [Ignavibacteriota bacterium]